MNWKILWLLWGWFRVEKKSRNWFRKLMRMVLDKSNSQNSWQLCQILRIKLVTKNRCCIISSQVSSEGGDLIEIFYFDIVFFVTSNLFWFFVLGMISGKLMEDMEPSLPFLLNVSQFRRKKILGKRDRCVSEVCFMLEICVYKWFSLEMVVH